VQERPEEARDRRKERRRRRRRRRRELKQRESRRLTPTSGLKRGEGKGFKV
jgi:hypothetical protein